VESAAFYEGRYAQKVIQVDSSRTGAEEEEMIAKLLAVESVDEPTEIVIHVNMLKEGWDVTNLYTIVPLRAANARTLIEQSIGRGLRLPYGKRTGVAAVDRLNIVAHDKFQEIIDEANRGDSPIRLKQVILEAPSPDDKRVSVQVGSGVMTRLGLTEAPTIITKPTNMGSGLTYVAYAPIFTTERERQAARVVMDVIGQYEVKRDLAPTSHALLNPEVQLAILAEVTERLKPAQGDLIACADGGTPALDLSALVSKTTEIVVQQTIDIPRIAVVPTGEVTTGFHPFRLGTLPNFQPGQREIVGQELRTNHQFTMSREAGIREQRFEDYIVKKLIDFDDIDYFTQAELLYDLAGQAVAHYQAQNYSESELHEVFDTYGAELARLIRAEMMAHFWEEATEYEVQVSRGFTELKPCNYTVVAGQTAHHYRETLNELGKIRQMLFGGFARCLYPLQKFDSDTERRFAVILERDSLKWFKPAKGQFQIYYKLGSEQPEYIPDFVAETDSMIFMVETKARADVDTHEVQAKAAAAARWCKHASNHALTVGSKPWRYVLVPHDEIVESERFSDFLRFQVSA
jgi:type III restriction enzyme